MSEDSDQTIQPIERQIYLDHRKALVDLGVAQIGLYDKTLLLLSTGALGVSALFVDTFVPEDANLNNGTLLAFAWIAFAATMLANLLSYLSSYYDTTIEIREWDEKYVAGDLDRVHDNPARVVTQWLNIIALISFASGLVALLVFCFSNLGVRA